MYTSHPRQWKFESVHSLLPCTAWLPSCTRLCPQRLYHKVKNPAQKVLHQFKMWNNWRDFLSFSPGTPLGQFPGLFPGLFPE
ncbi:hypothetical protein BU14_0209s0011 [Porphyra umbilicalis]|uniref:Uncharacterized protein n=1 Tax=Porphyra umbilicalis TaxID=2786 RepID=A0A1X6P550_PORUM|nr:hypothetical protein BU14_0209s0011 [Porphyra umbilicalis]|eukprot:OSX76019.1 hypothetical protein BU14_0209s0011 [Porphyra umbilicalis]